jgi:hypothetical protein
MNLFNLILIVLIITIEPFISFVFTNSLVFIKPENLTKTELVEKFKELSSSKSLKDLKNIKNEEKKDEDKITIKDFLKYHYSKLSSFISKYKSIISKIALFTILIKYFSKIKLMRFILRIINYIFFIYIWNFYIWYLRIKRNYCSNWVLLNELCWFYSWNKNL